MSVPSISGVDKRCNHQATLTCSATRRACDCHAFCAATGLDILPEAYQQNAQTKAGNERKPRFFDKWHEMLKKVHFAVDVECWKCCFFSTMNGLRFTMMVPRISGGGNMPGLLLAAVLALLSSCTGPIEVRNAKPLARVREPADQSGSVDSAEAFAQPAKDRPGLATSWGKSVKSPLGDLRFTRATAGPAGVDAIFYNNREGLEAMDAMDMKVDAMQPAAGGIIEWGIKGGLGYLPAYKSRTEGGYRRFAQGAHGGHYSIVIKNRCQCRVQVVASVDGLDVLDGKPASVRRPGYIIDPGQTLEIAGFRSSYDAVAAFQFSRVSESYANLRHRDTRNVGVIGIAVYTEKGYHPWTWMPHEVQTRQTATPFATAH